MSRTTAIVLTVVSALCCGLPGLFGCAYGAFVSVMSNNPDFRTGFESTSNGISADSILPMGIGFMCVSLILIAIPILVGFFTLRKGGSTGTAS